MSKTAEDRRGNLIRTGDHVVSTQGGQPRLVEVTKTHVVFPDHVLPGQPLLKASILKEQFPGTFWVKCDPPKETPDA